jgi:hypothetical protein
MTKLVYLMDTREPLTNEARALLELIAEEAKRNERQVFYVNNMFEEEKTFCMENGINHLDFKTVNMSDFEGAIFLTKVNYLIVLLTYITSVKNAKIALFNDHDLAGKRLMAQTLLEQPSLDEIGALLAETKSCAHIDGEALAELQSIMKGTHFPAIFLPIHIVDYEKNTGLSAIPQINDEINIAWYGTITPAALSYFNCLIQDLLSIVTTKKIVLHVISRGVTFWGADFTSISSKIRIIFLGELSEEVAIKYLRENVDIVVISGKNRALCSSLVCLPTIIPLNNAVHMNCRYIYMHDSLSYVLSLKTKRLHKIDNAITLENALNQIYKENKKKDIAEQCCIFVKEELAINSNNLQRLNSLLDTSMLTLEKLREYESIGAQIKAYEDYKKISKNSHMKYIDYIDYVNVKNARKIIGWKKRFLNSLFLLKKKIYNFAKKQYKIAKIIVKKILTNKIIYNNFYKQQYSFKKKKRNITQQFKEYGQIKVGFLVVFGSVFPARPVFEKMLNDKHFDPYIIVVPCVSRSMKYQRDTYKESFKMLSEIYNDRVINGYNIKNNEYLDLKDDYSILFFANPYKEMVHPMHNIEYFVDKDVLPIYISYGFAALAFWDEVIKTDFYNYLWKACVETESNLLHLKEKQKIKGINGIVTGYLKMDSLAQLKPSQRARKRILICPHHTVWGWGTLNISNFLKYSNLFIDLPKMFPEIDFIFRPHPLLFANLKAYKVWTQVQIDDFFDKMFASPNIVYDKSSDYYQQFVDSDAMIHDCGSFIGEYLYTKNPCCYMMKTEEETMKGLVPLGRACMQQYYYAFEEEDIINFITNVVIEGKDPKKLSREGFVEKELKINYPRASEFLIAKIKEELHILD